MFMADMAVNCKQDPQDELLATKENPMRTGTQ